MIKYTQICRSWPGLHRADALPGETYVPSLVAESPTIHHPLRITSTVRSRHCTRSVMTMVLVTVIVAGLWATADALTIRSVDGHARSVTSYGFAMGNTTFNVTGAPFLVDGLDRPSVIGADARNRVVFVKVTTVTVNVAEWASACNSNRCVGVVFHAPSSSLLHTTMEMLAWSYWVPQADAFATLPILAVADDIGTIDPSGAITMASDGAGIDRNPAAVALRLPSTAACFGVVAVGYAGIVVFETVRILQFVIDDKWKVRAPPWPPVISIFFLLLGHVVRTIRIVNVALFREQGLAYPALVFVSYIDMPIVAMSRAALNMNATLALEAYTRQRAKIIADRVAAVAGFLITTVMLIVVSVASSTQVLPMGVIETHLALLAPTIIYAFNNGFHCFVVVRQMVESRRRGTLTGQALIQRHALAVRICAAWTVSTLLLVSQLAVPVVQNRSPTDLLIASGASQAMSLFSTFSLLITYRPKLSAIDTCLKVPGWNRNPPATPALVGATVVVAPGPGRTNRVLFQSLQSGRHDTTHNNASSRREHNPISEPQMCGFQAPNSSCRQGPGRPDDALQERHAPAGRTCAAWKAPMSLIVSQLAVLAVQDMTSSQSGDVVVLDRSPTNIRHRHPAGRCLPETRTPRRSRSVP